MDRQLLKFMGSVLATILVPVLQITEAQAQAQTQKAPVESILGNWKGTSICRKVPGNESCNDEVTVYHFTRSATKPDMVKVQADKIVNGQTLVMGEFEMVYSEKDRRWEYEFSTRVHALWTFQAQGRELTGTLYVLPDRWVARDVRASKDD